MLPSSLYDALCIHLAYRKHSSHHVVYLRSGQKLGPGLQHNGVMVLRQGEWAMRGRSCHVGGWIKEGVFIVYERSKVFERCYDVYEWYYVACENVQRRA